MAALGMKRSEPFCGSPFDKKIKLEPGEDKNAACRLPICLSSSPKQVQHVDLPPDFLEPLSPEEVADLDVLVYQRERSVQQSPLPKSNIERSKASLRQFWKAGDYDGDSSDKKQFVNGMDHVRVHPKFLHSNATSHKWALGAFAELLDNALDEVAHGATFVKVDTLYSKGDGFNPMLLFEFNGGGMDPDRLRHCMSLGYSVKSKMANTIGQYGNGFKTSTMRLGADVIVFSCSPEREGHVGTRSIGLLSYTFLRETGQQDIVVPMIDFEVQRSGMRRLTRGNVNDWSKNMETIKQWSPFSTEKELLDQLDLIGQQGTRIIVYNLWENDEGELELDFDEEPHDIQLRGVNRDSKNIALAEYLPNSKHFLTYKHSLRSYASILYLRIPSSFKVILRGVEVRHHCLVDDLMIVEKNTYKPWRNSGGGRNADEDGQTHLQEALDMKAIVTIGFVKDAKEHADVQGFNVYHKNRLIKPFWRVWNAAGSSGRGIIGVLEANFVEPAHDKQGFERTSVLARLEARLLKMQKDYWCSHSHKIGYCDRHAKKQQQKGNASDKIAMESLVERKRSKLQGKIRVENKSDVMSSSPKLLVFPRSSRSLVSRLPSKRYRQDKHASMSTQLASSPKEASLVSLSPPEAEDFSLSPPEAEDFSDSQKTLDLVRSPDGSSWRIRWLQAQLIDMERQLEDAQKRVDAALNERDELRQELEEERRMAAVKDAEMRQKLRDTMLRVKELESTNKMIKASQCSA